ncbi:MAG: sigma-70 family RNA polymerase sigma factor [Opitutae bacterium]|nr:sigma-70 family RNA polymerase sigma factor [Opitutae bacterium]
MPPSEQARWFAEEVQPHEPELRAYLRARFPSLSDVDDIIQESYTRLLKAQAEGGVRSAKSFLFVTARNATLDLFRRRRGPPVFAIADNAELALIDETLGLAEKEEQAYRLEVLEEAVRALPDRCREVIMLRFLDGLSYKEIALQLGISPETVKVHMVKGMRRCTEFFTARGLLQPLTAEKTEVSA